MTFCEYIERICGEPQSDFQKKWFDAMEQHARSGCEISMPQRVGRMMNVGMILAINEWKQKYMGDSK
jgi:hypothetical protein